MVEVACCAGSLTSVLRDYLGRGGDLLTGTEQSGLYNKPQVTLLNAVGVLVSTGGQGQDTVRGVDIHIVVQTGTILGLLDHSREGGIVRVLQMVLEAQVGEVSGIDYPYHLIIGGGEVDYRMLLSEGEVIGACHIIAKDSAVVVEVYKLEQGTELQGILGASGNIVHVVAVGIMVFRDRSLRLPKVLPASAK